MDESTGNIVGFIASEKLTDEDYANTFIPLLEEAIDEYGAVRVLLQFINFEGWTAGAVWEDLKLWPKLSAIERIAIVGDEGWQDWMTWISRFIATLGSIQVRYFGEDRITEVWDWLGEGT